MADDIIQTLRMNKPLKFLIPVFRKNLFYDVQFLDTIRESEQCDHLKDFIVEQLAIPNGSKVGYFQANYKR